MIQALKGIQAPIELVAMKAGFAWSAQTAGIDNGCYQGSILYKGTRACDITLRVPGEHNLLNVAMATFEALQQLRTPEEIAEMRGKPVEEVLPFWERAARRNTSNG